MRADIAVIGGGASGMAAAIIARRYAPESARIVVLERLARVGKKLLATGNGRCNMTNTGAAEGGYHSRFLPPVERVIAARPTSVALEFLGSVGVVAAEEDGGRVYPASGQASSVLDALRLSMAERSVEEMCGFQVDRISPLAGGGFRLSSGGGGEITCRRVIIAAGSPASPANGGCADGLKLMRAIGHSIIEPMPALVQVRCDPTLVRQLKGIRIDAGVSLEVDGGAVRREYGEVLFTDYGLSGIPIMQISGAAGSALHEGRRAYVVLTAAPGGEGTVRGMLTERAAMLSRRKVENFLVGYINKRVGQALIKLALPDLPTGQLFARECGDLSEAELASIARLLTCWRLEVLGTEGFDRAQVAAGGVSTREFDPCTMESAVVPGMYLCGEVLDVDGDCGGYNLQWAWASGMLAGEMCARSLGEGGRYA